MAKKQSWGWRACDLLGYLVSLIGGFVVFFGVVSLLLALFDTSQGSVLDVLPATLLFIAAGFGLYKLGFLIGGWVQRKSKPLYSYDDILESILDESAARTVEQTARTPQIGGAPETPKVNLNATDLSGLKTKSSDAPIPHTVDQQQTSSQAHEYSALMTGQLVARYKQTHDQALRDEYLRRLQVIGLSESEAERLFLFELMILKHYAIERLASDDYLTSTMFNLEQVVLSKDASYYIDHQSFLVSEIVKIWDEAEWHYWNSHEANLPDDVWAEIYSLSRYGGGKLFIEYLQMVAEKSSVPFDKVQAYSVAEQNMIFKYKWNAGKNEPHPYKK